MPTNNSKNTQQPKNRKIYVLSIGIDWYKSDHVYDLAGCVNDVVRLKTFFQKQFHIPDDQYRVLINHEATRDGIIEAFRTHFKQLQDGDIALFHYSGHGSWEKTSGEFIEAQLEPIGSRNEVIVCHDSRTDGVYNLADKELRVLISELQYPSKGSSRNIHFACLFDCCHSGSMLRKEEPTVRVRMTSSSKHLRSLDTYLDQKYAKQWKETGSISYPPVDYISMAACSPRESAIEDQEGGLFTSALIRALGMASHRANLPSYAQLFALIREITKTNANNLQTPYFEYAGRVNPFDAFLLQGETTSNAYPEIVQKDGELQVTLGALHGLKQQ